MFGTARTIQTPASGTLVALPPKVAFTGPSLMTMVAVYAWLATIGAEYVMVIGPGISINVDGQHSEIDKPLDNRGSFTLPWFSLCAMTNGTG